MKYYSEKLNKIFDTVEALEAAEKEKNKKEQILEKYEKQLDELFESITKDCEKYIDVYDKYVKEKQKNAPGSTVPYELCQFDELINNLFK